MSLRRLVAEAKRPFAAQFGGEPTVLAQAPGRINLIGEHTDYLGGLAMPAAVDRWVLVAARRRADRRADLYSAAFDERVSLDLDALPAQPKGWLAFGVGALALFAKEVGGLQTGFDAVILGNVPLGGGMSSSAALSVALLHGLCGLYAQPLDDLTRVRLAQAIEHHYLGVPCGLLDPMASQLSRAGQVLVVDFRDLRWRYVPAGLPDWRWVLVDSGVRRALAQSAYEDRVASCREGLAALRAAGRAEHWREATLAMVEQIGGSAPWVPRLRHGITENQRVLDAAEALAAGDVERLGRLLVASHQSLRDDYAVSCPELDLLAETAWSLPGCAGGRMMGGGFGGCTLNLVAADRVEGFAERISAVFQEHFGRCAPSWTVRLVGGAGLLPG